MRNALRYFNSSPEVIHLAVMMYVRYPLSLRQVEDLPFDGMETIPRFTFEVRHHPAGMGSRWGESTNS